MRRTALRTALLLALAAASGPARTGRAAELDLAGALVLARERSPAVAAIRARVERARAAVVTAGTWSSNPEVEGALTEGLGGAGGDRRFEIGLGMDLEVGGQRGLRRTVASRDLDAARDGSAAAERAFLADAAEAFLRAIALEEASALARERAASAAEVSRIAARREAAGDLAPVERTLAEVELARAEAADVEAGAAANRARLALFRMLGLGVGPEEEAPVLAKALPAPPEPATADRRDVRALEAEARAREVEGELRAREALPVVRVEVGYEREDTILEGLRDEDHLGRVALSLPLPLLDRRRGPRAEALAAAGEARLLAADVAAAARIEEDAARASSDAARRRLSAVEPVVRAAEGALRELERAWATGLVDLTDVLVARDRLVQARADHLEARLDVSLAWVDLVRALGLDPFLALQGAGGT